ncbi:hypothetical protein ACO2Q3_09125 [Caulobacter sp. KR2-114]|uniref:hypothetical protein n=1 Tax=Caulobacter sp. KR2-114 TaxID=3400912 RepID=UPI003C058568
MPESARAPVRAPDVALPGAYDPARAPAAGLLAFWTLAVLTVAAAGMAAMAFTLPVDHDESQYVAAALAAARGLRPYADFVYLQTPLQPALTAPLARLAGADTLLAIRLANALAGALLLTLVFRLQVRLGVERARAATVTALLGACYIFEFSCGVARNDALPALAAGLGLWAALAALDLGAAREGRAAALWGLAGVGFGAAVSFKVFYLLPLAAAGLFLVAAAWRRQVGVGGLAAFCLGAVGGLAPCLAALAAAPGPYVYDTLLYHQTAPAAWYAATGQAQRLSALAKLPDSLLALAVGPALEVLAGVGLISVARWRAGVRASPQRRLVEVLALAGLLAALVPTPTQRQYFLPLLPALFVLWGIGEEGLPRALPWRRAVTAAVLAGALIGAGRVIYLIGDAVVRLARGDLPPVLALQDEGRWVGARLRAAGVAGDIATAAPQLAAASGYDLDARLAAGPFFYRTGDQLGDARQAGLHAVSPRTLAAAFDAAPPAALVVGLEPRKGLNGRSADDDFRAYAQARGWRREVSPDGVVELYIRPGAGRS